MFWLRSLKRSPAPSTWTKKKSHDEYDEKVLVKEAWDEQVIDFYECDCGARKY